MATFDELSRALIAADKAGDVQAAKILAGEITRMRTQPAAPATRYDPTEGMSGLEKFNAGVGKAFSDAGLGIRQRLGMVSDADVEESRRLGAPLMNTKAGLAGNIGGNVAMLAPTALIPGAGTVPAAAAMGGLIGAIQPSTSVRENVLNIGLGAAGGAGGQAVANRISAVAAQPGNLLTQGQRQAAQGGQNLGMRLTPGKASGSTVLQKIEAAAESNPMTTGGFDAIKNQNQRILNRAAARSVGENADELSTPILARVEGRLGQVFDQVADATPVPLNPQTVGPRLQQILNDSQGLVVIPGHHGLGGLDAHPLWQQLDNFANTAGGATREQLRALSSKMGKAARNNMTTPNGDRELGQSLFRAQEVVEDAIQGSLAPAQQAAYNEARNQYRNLMLLTAKTNVVNPSSGNVAGRPLANTLMSRDRGGFTMGRNNNDLYEATRFVQAFPDIVGNSGTATRSMGPADYMAGIPGNLLFRLYLSQPATAAAAAGAGAMGAGARLLDNPLLHTLAMPVGTVGGLQVPR